MANGCLKINEFGECGCSTKMRYISKEALAFHKPEFYAFLENSTTYPISFDISHCRTLNFWCSEYGGHMYALYTDAWRTGKLGSQEFFAPVRGGCNQTTHLWGESVDYHFYGCIQNYTGPRFYFN